MDYYLGLKCFYGPFGHLKESNNNLNQNITKDVIKRDLLKNKLLSSFSKRIKYIC